MATKASGGSHPKPRRSCAKAAQAPEQSDQRKGAHAAEHELTIDLALALEPQQQTQADGGGEA